MSRLWEEKKNEHPRGRGKKRKGCKVLPGKKKPRIPRRKVRGEKNGTSPRILLAAKEKKKKKRKASFFAKKKKKKSNRAASTQRSSQSGARGNQPKGGKERERIVADLPSVKEKKKREVFRGALCGWESQDDQKRKAATRKKGKNQKTQQTEEE